MLHGRLGWYLVSDTSNPQRPAPVVRPLDVRADATSGDGQLVVLSRPGTASPAGFQHIPDTKSGQDRLRLGQVGDDLDAATADAETLGSRWPEPGQIPRARRFQWRLMADPDGSEFDSNVLPVPGGGP
jgi:Glyoxalase-like domain